VGLCHEADLPAYFPQIAAAVGAAYTLAGRVAEAVPLLTQAVEQTMAKEMVDEQGLCRLSLGEAYLLAGRLEEAQALAEQARAELSTAIEMYTSMEMTFWLPQTEATLAQVEGR
jgi:tetratricopeptide (TPR) repeat protein